MRKIFKTALYLAVTALTWSCVLDQIDSQPAAEPRLDCDALDSYTIQAGKPQDISFRVSSTTPWSITGFEDTPWISVEPASSAVSSLSEDIRIKTVANTALSDRSVVLTLQGENISGTRTITLTQLRKGKLTVTPIAESDEFAINGSSQTFQVSSNLDWEVSAEDAWLSFSPAKGESAGEMKTSTITATAAANKSVNRSTLITVVSGDEKFQFTVKQKGQTLEFAPVEQASIDRKGGSLTLKVNATMDWKIESDNEAFAVQRQGDEVTVEAPFNNRFGARKVLLTVKPVSNEFGDVSSTLEVSQECNFKLEGNCELQEDGSVKLSAGNKARVSTVDDFRFVSIVLTMGESGFGSKAQFWCAVNAEGCNIYNQLTLGGNTRIRTDGTLPVAGQSSYKNTTYSITQEELNAMTEYRFDVLPDSGNSQYHFLRFYYNGSLKAEQNYLSVFCDAPEAAGPYWFGFYDNGSDDTWYIVKTCDITAIAE